MSDSTCPICHRPTDANFRLFCSRHCADVDLGRWFSGTYRFPSFRQDNEEEQDEYRDGEG